MHNITWIIQTNGGCKHPLNAEKLINVCDELGLNHIDITVNDGKIPQEVFKASKPFVFYGLDALIRYAYKSEKLRSGVFYNPNTFNQQAFISNYNQLMLNSDVEIYSIQEFVDKHYSPNQQLFVKPTDDAKIFIGQTMIFDNWKHLFHQLANDTKIAVSTPKEILQEWRFFIVNNQIISYCQYAPIISQYVLPEAIQFVKNAIEIWTPSDVFTLDIALTNDNEYRIVECNAFNWSGFYICDVSAIVRAISLYKGAN